MGSYKFHKAYSAATLLSIVAVLMPACSLPRQSKSYAANTAHVDAVSSVPAETKCSADTPHSLDHSIREVDFLNFTYDWFPEGFDARQKMHSVTLKDGSLEFDIPSNKTADIGGFEFTDISYGDVTGDGVEDAVIVLMIDNVGNSHPFGVLVYTLKDKLPKLLWAHTSGGGGMHGLRDAYAKDGHLVVEEYNPKVVVIEGKNSYPGGAETYTRVYYEWDGKTLHAIKSEDLPNEHDHAHFNPGPCHNEIREASTDN